MSTPAWNAYTNNKAVDEVVGGILMQCPELYVASQLSAGIELGWELLLSFLSFFPNSPFHLAGIFVFNTAYLSLKEQLIVTQPT